MGAAHPNSTSLTIYWLSVYSVLWQRRKTEQKTIPEQIPALVLRRKSGETVPDEKKRRLSERSEFLRFRREAIRSRLKTEAGVFSFCYLFLFDAKKKK